MSGQFNNSLKVGILGGGQLGRMLIQAAIDLDLTISVLDPDEQSPCRYLCQEFVKGAFTDYATVFRFGLPLDLITIEIENVNVAALRELEKLGKKIYPQPDVIELIQDKRQQKEFYKQNGIPTADFVLTENLEHTRTFGDFLPAFHKMGKGGYDGKGVKPMLTTTDLANGFDVPGLLEKKIPFEKELAIIVSRNEFGEVATFPLVEMVFDPVYNLVDYLISPAQISSALSEKATSIARNVVEKLGIIGILAVEMFLTADGEILVNEIAPRPHNSGHHTIKANITSQYEQHWRAILGLPFGSTELHKLSAMVNVLGAPGSEGDAVYIGLQDVLRKEGIHVHLYGKKITKPSRKMGHIIIMEDDMEKLKEKVTLVKQTVRVIA